MNILQWLQFALQAAPAVTSFIGSFKHADGTSTVVVRVANVEKLNTQDATDIQDFLNSLDAEKPAVAKPAVPIGAPGQPGA